jgi:hypothetical protein
VSAPSLTYAGIHRLLRDLHGPAREHPCADCRTGKAAREWAYSNAAPDELVDKWGRRYSPDPRQYRPLCPSCHRRVDAPVMVRRRAEQAEQHAAQWAAEEAQRAATAAENRLLTPDEAAEALGLTLDELQRLWDAGYGPPRMKLGKHVRYRPRDVEQFLAGRVVDGSADAHRRDLAVVLTGGAR